MTDEFVPPFPEPLPSQDQSVQELNTAMFNMAGHLKTFVSAVNETATLMNSLSANALLAANGSTSLVWVSGTTYAEGDVRWSPSDFLDYRRKTNGAGTVDPKDDPANWVLRSKTSLGGADIHTSAADITLTNMDPRFHVVSMIGPALRVKLPPANTMQKGVAVFEIKNVGGYRFAVVRNDQTFLCFVYPGQTVSVNLSDASTSAGKWHVFGQNLQNIYDLNAPVQLLNGASDSFGAAKLTASKLVLAYRKNSDGKLYARTVNVGSAAGVETQIGVDTGITNVSITSTTATQVVITYRLSTNTVRSIVVDVAGDAFTTSSSVDCETGGSSSAKDTKTTAVSATKVLVHWVSGTNSSAFLYFRPITITGSTPALGALVTTTLNTPGGLFSVTKISATKLIISYPWGPSVRFQMQSDTALTGTFVGTTANFDTSVSASPSSDFCLINSGLGILFTSFQGVINSNKIGALFIDVSGLTPVIGRITNFYANLLGGAAKLSSVLIDPNTIYLSWSGCASLGVDGMTLKYTSDGDIRVGILAERIDGLASTSEGSVINIPIDSTTVLQFTRKTTPELVCKTVRIADMTDTAQIATTSASSAVVVGGEGGPGGGSPGDPGQSAYLYVRYANAEDGSGFTDIPSGTAKYVGLLQTIAPVTPVQADFAGKWQYWGGVPGSQILSGTVDPTSEGNPGDWYLKVTDPAMMFGPRTSDPITPWPGPGIQIGGEKGDTAGFKYKLGASTTEANPGNYWFRLNSATYSAAAMTELYVSATAMGDVNIKDILDNLASGYSVNIQRATAGNQVFYAAITSVTANDSGAWYSIGISYLGGNALTPTATDPTAEYVITFNTAFGLQQILENNIPRYDQYGNLIDKNGVAISGVRTGTYAQMQALTPISAYNRDYFHVTDYGYKTNGLRYRCNGEIFFIDGVERLHDLFSVRKNICTASQASAIASNGGKVQVTITAHGYTTANAVGAELPILSWSGSGALPGSYKILTVDDVNKVTIDLNYNSSFGVPVVGLIGTLVPLPSTISIPPLNDVSQVDIEILPFYGDGTGIRYINTYFNGVLINTGKPTPFAYRFSIRNMGAKNLQEVVISEHFGAATDASESDLIATNENTANPSTITFKSFSENANEVIGIKRIYSTIRG